MIRPTFFAGLPHAFWVLFAGTLINRVAGFVLTFLAIYLTDVRGLSVARAGAIVSCYGAGALGAALMGGVLADRLGRRPTLVGSLVAGAGAMLLLGAARTLPAIAAAAALTGMFYELYRPVVSAAVADLVPPDDRLRAYSLIYWAVNAGAAVAPILGAAIAARSYRALFAADAATTFLFGALVWRAMPETRPAAVASSDHGLRVVARDRVFLLVCGLMLALHVVFFQAFVAFPLDVRAHGFSTATFGGLIALNGVLIVLLQPSAGTLIAGRPRFRVLALASLLVGAGFGMYAVGASVPWYACAVAVWTAGEILLSPAAASLAADLAPVELRGRYQGVLSMSFSAAFLLAPLVGAWVAGTMGFRALWSGGLVVGAAAALGFLALAARRPAAPGYLPP